jgi:hypothetical protein
MPSSENLFSTLSYAVFVAPCAIVVIWVVWRVLAWCRFHVARVLPGLAVRPDEAPRVFARSTSNALLHVFVFFLLLPLVLVPLRYLADRIEGPQISFWHWLLVAGPIPVLVAWLVARIRRSQQLRG